MSTEKNTIYRIQDADGRGPYKPGMSAKWADKEGGNYKGEFTRLPPFMDEFGDSILNEINIIMNLSGGSFGCGFRSMEELCNWFSPSEIERMKVLGYRIVKIEPDKILRSSHRQTVFWCKKKLNRVAEAV